MRKLLREKSSRKDRAQREGRENCLGHAVLKTSKKPESRGGSFEKGGTFAAAKGKRKTWGAGGVSIYWQGTGTGERNRE